MSLEKNNPIIKVMQATGMTQEDLAKQLNVTRQSIINYKKAPGTIPLEKMIILSQISGMTIEELSGGLNLVVGPTFKPTYEKYYNRLEKAIKYAEKQIKIIEKIKLNNDENSELFNTMKSEMKCNLENLLSIARIQGRKIKMCAFGQSDTGKSTLTNYLLQEEVAPTSYSPITTVPTYFMHISEKPSYLNKNDNAVVFGTNKGSELEKFNHDFLYNKDIAEKYILKSGSCKYILNECGTRKGEYYDNKSIEISEIVVFLENDALKEITFVDIPGFGSEDKREDVGLTMDMAQFDIVFFLSLANGFFREEEMTALNKILTSRKDLNSIYILATHANAVGSPEKVNTILDIGCDRLVKFMTKKQRKKLSISINDYRSLRERFFGFDAFSKYYCDKLNEDLEKLIPHSINTKFNEVISSLKKASREYKNTTEIEINKIMDTKKGTPSNLPVEYKFDDEVSRKIEAFKDDLDKKLLSCRKTSLEEFSRCYADVMNEEFIINALKEKGVKNKKNDIKIFANYLCSELDDSVKEILDKHSNEFVEELKINLENFQESFINGYKDKKFKINMNGFDFNRAFASGLAGVSAYGALALWATIVAAGSNLGGYILVAKIVSALSAIGISLGGTASVATFVSSLGGPVTFAIALALLVTITTFGILSGNWRSRLAKKLIKSFEKENSKGQCVDSIEEYWNDTEKALNACLETLKSETIKYYKNQVFINNQDEKVQYAIITILNEAIKVYDEFIDC